MYKISSKFLLGISMIASLQSLGQSRQLANHKSLKPETAVHSETIYLDFYLPELPNVDTITIAYWKKVLSDENNLNRFLPHEEKRILKSKKGYFQCKITGLTAPAYLSVSLFRDSLFKAPLFFIDKYLMEPGDSIRMNISRNPKYSDTIPHFFKDELALKYNTAFSGKGSAKYTCRFLADRTATLSTINPLFDYKNDFNVDNHWDIGLNKSLSLLEEFRPRISRRAWQLMKADFVGRYEYEKFEDFWSIWWQAAGRNGDTMLIKKLIVIFDEKLLKKESASLQQYAKTLSNNYPAYLLIRTRVINTVLDKLPDVKSYYKLKKEYRGELRDKLLTIFLLSRYNFDQNLQSQLEDALRTVRTKYCLLQLRNFYSAQSRGVHAFNFSLPDTANQMVSLKDLKNKVVFMDFWYTGCLHCADYYQEQVAKVEKEFATNPGVVFLSVSIDRERKMWLKSVHSGRYTTASSSNVVNLYTAGQGDDHPVIKHYNISGYPTPILIGKDGRIFCTNQLLLRTKNGLSRQIKAALNGK